MSHTALTPPETASVRDSSLEAWSEPAAEVARCLASMSSATMPTARPAPGSKPTRLSLACNACRKRKVRCDARQPKCQNCTLRGEVCETSDLRRPGAPSAPRRRATRRHSVAAGFDDPCRFEGQTSVKASVPEEPENNEPSSHQPGSPAASASFHNPEPHVYSDGLSATQTITRRTQVDDAILRRPRGDSDRADNHHTRAASSTSPGTTRSQADSELGRLPHGKSQRPKPDDVSWVSRAYQESTAAQSQSNPPPRDQGDELSSPAVVTPDVVVNTDDSTSRLKVLGGSSLQCLFNFTDLWLAGYGFDHSAPLFRHGMSNSEEFSIPLRSTLPDLPQRHELMQYVDIVFERIWPLYPVIDRGSVEAEIDSLLALQSAVPQSLQTRMQPAQVPSLALTYALICIGMNETQTRHAHPDSSLERKVMYLTSCYGLLGHLTAMPYESSVRALLFMTLALRGHCKDGQAWHVIGQAVRTALSLGLHKSAERLAAAHNKGPPHPSTTKPAASGGAVAKGRSQQEQFDESRSRLWWSCYALERLAQLECGRPSGIDHEYDILAVEYGLSQMSAHGEEDHSTSNDNTIWFPAWISLAGIMGQISDRLYAHRFCGSGEMLAETARHAKCLTEWEAALPEELRPQNTFFDETDHNHVVAVFLSQQYYHAQIAVLRSSIIFPEKSFTGEVKKRSRESPAISRLLGAASMCVQAARNLVVQTLQLADAEIQSTLIGVSQTFLASVVLSLSILRAPNSTLARSDVELLTAATEYVEQCYGYWGFQPAFIAILSRLRERVIAVFKQDVKMRGSLSEKIAGISTFQRGEAGFSSSAVDSTKELAPLPVLQGLQSLSRGFSVSQSEMDQAFAPSRMDDVGTMPSELGIETFMGMEFEDLWNMMDADLVMYDVSNQFHLA